MMDQFPLLLYLAVRLRARTPQIPRELARYLPQAALVEDVARYGLDGAASLHRTPSEHLARLVDVAEWEDLTEPTPADFRLAVVRQVETAMRADPDLRFDQQLSLYASMDRYLKRGEVMLAVDEGSLGVPPDGTGIPTWRSGFGPLDLVTGGLYQGLLVFMADTGVGKTSTMLTLAEELKRHYPGTTVLYYSLEIPKTLLLQRMTPIAARGWPFTADDRVIAGVVTVQEIVARTTTQGWKDQVVVVDTPDAMDFTGVEERRFALEAIYRELVKVKECSRLVVTASQVRRNDSDISLQSVSEAYDKVRYADIVVSITPRPGGRFRMKSLKNRFGLSQITAEYGYDLATLGWTASSLVGDADGDF